MSQAIFVYVISGDHGRCKIGVTDNPRQRLAQLQTGSPFNLQYEFVGLTEGTGFDIEGEAHFLLSKHKSPGGEEWFTVPPEVAITAVMAAARQRGHTIKPVDPDNIPASACQQIGQPRWEVWVKKMVTIAGVCLLYRSVDDTVPAGTMVVAFAIEGAFVWLAVKLVQWLLIKTIREFREMWFRFDNFMHPPDGPRAPLFPDRN